MVDKVVAATTTAALAASSHPSRTLISFTNTGAADEVVYVSTSPETVATSAWTIYNRETLKMTGSYAQKAWYIIASANVNVYVSEEF